MARDEEAMLPGCLASVRGAVDEIVLVDTGSSDRTIQIARAEGAKVRIPSPSFGFARASSAPSRCWRHRASARPTTPPR
ncbi:MAG TPA: glycosyltransferase [Anaeromyxobacter sp.]